MRSTKHNMAKRISFTAAACAIAFAPITEAAARSTRSQQSTRLISTETRNVAGQQYTLQKFVDARGNLSGKILNEQGLEISEKEVPAVPQKVMGPYLAQALLNQTRFGDVFQVKVALALTTNNRRSERQSGMVELQKDGAVGQVILNGKETSLESLQAIQTEEHQARALDMVDALETRQALLADFSRRYGVTGDAIERAMTSTSNVLRLALDENTIEEMAFSGDPRILSIELNGEAGAEVAEAMAATDVSTFATPFMGTRGENIGVYYTEGYCPDESALAGPYTNLGGSTDLAGSVTGALWHSEWVGSILRAVAPESSLYCRSGLTLPDVFDIYGAAIVDMLESAGLPVDFTPVDPPVEVVSMSWGMSNSTSYDEHSMDWDNFVYEYEVPAFVSVGNSGADELNSRSSGLNVIAVGNYDDDTDAIHSASSFGEVETGNAKPEIVAPATNVEAGGKTGTGTSAASPHAAAFLADSLSAYGGLLAHKPAVAKAAMLGGATDPIVGSVSGDVGEGGINFLSMHYGGWGTWLEGANADFSAFDAADGAADGFVSYTLPIDATSYNAARVTISWLNRGDFTFAHKADLYPIGQDYDLLVFDPSGVPVGYSTSRWNSYETVDFDVTETGTYTIKVMRFANNDPDSDIRLGMFFNLYNK